MTVAGQTKELNIIETIKPGYSRDFELHIPSVPIDKSEYAEIECVSSAISWRQHIGKKKRFHRGSYRDFVKTRQPSRDLGKNKTPLSRELYQTSCGIALKKESR